MNNGDAQVMDTAVALAVMDRVGAIEEGEAVDMSKRPSLDGQTLRFFVQPPRKSSE